ncbi:FAD-dependent oxidoreductase [Paenibacillus sp. IB182496]|uniref:FAD-dependent oxidoreductase n=2 Tax=Paenibacillus sabuli TaxID=2772509 RepID=A0A927BS51_9BACL|nr:FAD-dependent oxidoreductase [Paenibacillus sabuli]
MDLYQGELYWPTTNEPHASYPTLEGAIRTRVAIIGGGMSGALSAYTLSLHGIDTVLLDREQVAGGSTSANTGLLQFSNDIMLHELAKQLGKGPAVRFYQACGQAVARLGELAVRLELPVNYAARDSLYYASSEQDVPRLQQEFEWLQQAGFDVDYWDPARISAHFPFRKPGAIVTRGDAEVNPYRFVQALVRRAAEQGALIREHTEIVRHTSEHGIHRLETADGDAVVADAVLYAIGYEPEELRGKLIRPLLNRSFAAVTVPQTDLAAWHERMLIWETARPYFYARTTPSGRIVLGGLDEEKREPIHGKRPRARRAGQLEARLSELFPSLDTRLEFAWSATFGESADDLPFIGPDPGWAGVYYCLGYGGNGTVYSMIAADLLVQTLSGERHPVADIVALDRPTLQRT